MNMRASACSGAHLLVRGPIDAALRVAHRCRDHAVHPLQMQLRAPEATSRHGAHRVAVRRRRRHLVRVRVSVRVRALGLGLGLGLGMGLGLGIGLGVVREGAHPTAEDGDIGRCRGDIGEIYGL